MRGKKVPALSTILYILAGLLALYTLWAAFYSFDYISKMIAQNQLVIRGNEFEIVNFHMSNFAQYLLFAVILFTLGRILQMNLFGTVNTGNQVVSSEEISDDATDEDDFEDWFQHIDE
ncbi:hypothetical protein SAMN05446037_102833 [Anaerovirgula multivorans]|uniref:Uncharacterized protein n=1 Tax=Anaerovirgula multivorans TaxID=312168 RepID=A0A239IIX6_9FIRM|nr:hypothetical protein [Anaerovirgula multivorans]SNS93362.1 hypothetical protein SAMN05446037_102833 [Anaerovirgula multivorans]